GPRLRGRPPGDLASFSTREANGTERWTSTVPPPGRERPTFSVGGLAIGPAPRLGDRGCTRCRRAPDLHASTRVHEVWSFIGRQRSRLSTNRVSSPDSGANRHRPEAECDDTWSVRDVGDAPTT